MTSLIRQLIKWFYFCFALIAIVIAVIVQAGRSFSFLVADNREPLAHYLSEKLNARVTIGKINAEWVGLKPIVDLQDLRITSQQHQPIIALKQAHMRLDLLGTLLHARLVWSALELQQVEMDFVQSADGFWRVAGIPPKADKVQNDEAAQLDYLMDVCLLSRRIEFSQTQMGFHFASGDVTHLNSPLLRMENAGDFHRLALEVDVNGKPKTLTLIAEGQGDPRHRETFTSQGYLQLKEFPTNEPVAATTALLLRGIKAEVHSEGHLDANLWFNSRPKHEGLDLVGQLNLQRLSLPVNGKRLAMDSFKTDLIGHWLYSGQWHLALQHINANINENKVDNINFAASADNFSAPVVLHLQKLDLQRLHNALDGSGVLGEGRLREVIKTLSPQGELRNLQVAIPTDNPLNWELQANLNQVGVNAWQGVPALRQVDGFVHADQKGGFVDIDSHNGFSMHYYPTYTAPMEYREAKGQVAWYLQPDKNQIYVNSGLLDFTGEVEHARGYMWLSIPWVRNSGDIDLYLQIGATHLNASQYTKYTPAVIPSSLLGWLSKSIGDHNLGAVDHVGFLYRGTLNSHNHMSRSHQLFMDIQHAELNYHPEWPALSQLNGRLLVRDEHVDAWVDSAKLFDSDVAATQVTAFPNPDGHGSLLKVMGDVSGSAQDGLRVLREGALRRYLGASLDSWTMEGQIKTALDIAVPLDAKGTGSAQQIDIEIEAPKFDMGNLRLSLQDVVGHIGFNQDKGLYSEPIQAVLFDEPVTAKLATQMTPAGSQTQVSASGKVFASRLAKWSQRPEALFLQGKLDYDAKILLNHGHKATDSGASIQPFADITVTSPLKGVAVNLPAPYGKVADQEQKLLFNMQLFEKNSLVSLSYGDHVQAIFDLNSQENNRLNNANIALGAPAALAVAPSFLVSGHIAGFDVEQWKQVFTRYQDFSSQTDAMTRRSAGSSNTIVVENPELIAGLPFKADLLVDAYRVGPVAFEEIQVTVERLVEAWKIRFSNPLIDGQVLLPSDTTRPLQIDLESLKLTSKLLGVQPNADAGIAPQVPAANVDPRALPLADISVNALYMDDINYGNWSLQLRPNASGAAFENIHGSVKGVNVGGKSPQTGATLNWLVVNNQSQTQFKGRLSAANLADVLKEWQKPDTVESSSSYFDADLSWVGAPQDVQLNSLNGTTDLFVEHGRFKRSAGAGDGVLRLMAILNFDSLARRLKLDFSDLYNSGLAFDEITGKVKFASGTMTFLEPLDVKTPSSRMQMAGVLDLDKETIDAHLVATLPVVGNYTFFTALVTGLPAAAGVYLVSKLFKKQVDQATSLSYSVRGSWGAPEMSFESFFESQEGMLEKVKRDAQKKTEKTKSVKKKVE